MITVQYIADHTEWSNPPTFCSACGKSVKDDNSAVLVTLEHTGGVWADIVLCDDCRRELFEKI